MEKSRGEILFMLSKAAELEIMLCNSYLFAAFSTKRNRDHFPDTELATEIVSWTQQISLVARQEMEHLALVNNIITAIGGAPYFNHPNFPAAPGYTEYDLTLERLNLASIDRFIAFERPDEKGWTAIPPQTDGLEPPTFKSIGELYAQILRAMKAFPGGETALFIGPADAQINGQQLMLDFPRKGQMGGVFGVTLFPVTNMATAQQAIELIVEQGEGSSNGHADVMHDLDPNDISHEERFENIRDQMIKFDGREDDISYPVVKNPILYAADHRPDETTLVTYPPAREVMGLFNTAYEITILLLMRLFFYTDETEEEAAIIRQAAFFPMMTMVIRPLGEILVTLPAFEKGGYDHAGPSFETYRSTNFLPHKSAAWQILGERFDELSLAAASTVKTLKNDPDYANQADDLAFAAESIALIGRRFKFKLGLGD